MSFPVKSIEIYDKLRNQILSDIILDPSLLVVGKFWDQNFDNLRNSTRVFFPQGLKNIEENNLHKIYGGYRKKQDLLSYSDTISYCSDNFMPFSYTEFLDAIPQSQLIKFSAFRSILEEISHPASTILLDEAVFLLTKSSIASRLKKSLKFFEDFNIFPLVNLEKEAPEELRETISGLKKAINLVRYLATPVFIAIGPVGNIWTRMLDAIVIEGIRLLMIDP